MVSFLVHVLSLKHLLEGLTAQGINAIETAFHMSPRWASFVCTIKTFLQAPNSMLALCKSEADMSQYDLEGTAHTIAKDKCNFTRLNPIQINSS